MRAFAIFWPGGDGIGRKSVSGCGMGRLLMTGWPLGILDLLLKQRMTVHTVQVWASYLGGRWGDCPDSNILFNGDFENTPTGAALDASRRRFRDRKTSITGTLPRRCARARGNTSSRLTREREISPQTRESPPHLPCGVDRAVGRLSEWLRGRTTNDWTRLEKGYPIRSEQS